MIVFKRLVRLAKPHTAKLLLAMFFMLIVGGLTSVLAFLVKPALDDIFVERNASMLQWIPLAIIAIYLVKGVCTYAQSIIMNWIGQRIVTDLRNHLYNQIQRQSLSFFTKNPTGVLMSRITFDVNYIQGAVSEAITSLMKDSFTILCLVFVVFWRDWKLAIIAMVVFPLTVYPISRFGRKIRKAVTGAQITMGSLTSLLQETITGARIVKAFCMEAYENKRFAKESENLLKLFMKAVSVNALSSPLMEFLGGIGIAVIIFYGGWQVIHGTSTPGTFFSFLAALIMLYEPIKRLTATNNQIQQGISAAERVFAIVDAVPEIRNRPDAVELPNITKGIDIQDVTFRYEEDTVLRNINLSIRAGETLALVGMSGGGKTTLVNLIPRFYDVSEGSILIDGRDIREATIESLRGQIGIVTQQTILFNDTVRNNIAYGNQKASEEDLIAAARAANAHDFISKLPNGYDTLIGEQGMKLSGGERQRISIARAILKDAPILILDEATSSLDTEAEIEVQEALENLMKGRTTLVIAHRLSTIRNADRIIVLVNGAIIEEGNHETLLERQGEYRRLYNMQFREG
ncbi:MAG: lipid A export permease/ATP-binding protein MsbA [Deltaproteobacteria bacterium HGW-Deltaproteobacteria-19]|nr:MAG: lipid A export permease/ATP-binding protein MsbA [Deltaproteobacteria bacterium HGW-Deltaproteobacteria-19]